MVFWDGGRVGGGGGGWGSDSATIVIPTIDPLHDLVPWYKIRQAGWQRRNGT